MQSDSHLMGGYVYSFVKVSLSSSGMLLRLFRKSLGTNTDSTMQTRLYPCKTLCLINIHIKLVDILKYIWERGYK
jgi:hypothetical protein